MSELPEWKVPLYKIFRDSNDLSGIAKIIQSGMNWATGPCVQEFEKRVAEYAGVSYAISFNSGTSALHAMMLAAKIGAGDEVIAPSFTFISTPNSVMFVGAKPVFADIEDMTYGLDPGDVQRRITSQTRAILPIHYGGLPCRIDELREIAEDHHLLLLEDAAESLGAEFKGKRVGSFGEQAVLSFCGNKVITTGEGGMVLTNNEKTCSRLKLIRSHGRLETESYLESSEAMDYVDLGYNWRLSNILASLGISQLAKIEQLIRMRQEKATRYTQLLKHVEGIRTPSIPPGCRHVFQMYTIRLNEAFGPRDQFAERLTSNGICAKIYFPPVHLTSFYRGLGHHEGELPKTEKISREVVSLPIYPELTDGDMRYVVSVIREFHKQGVR